MHDLYPTRLPPALAREPFQPRRDPVVYAAKGARGPLTAEQVERYERDGFLVLENWLSAAETRALLDEAQSMRRAPETLEPETVVEEPGEDGVREVRSVFAIHRQAPAFGKLAADPRLADVARFILDDEVYIHQSRLNYKPAFAGKEFYWHSDFETWRAEDGMPRMRALSMSVMLTDNHPQSGPTMFVTGSHAKFAPCAGETPGEHYKSSLRKQEYGVPSHDQIRALVEEGAIVAPAPKAGSVVLFDCNTLHGSNGNITPFERCNAFLVFNAWSNRLQQPFAAPRARPEFLAHRAVDAPLPHAGADAPRAA